MSEAGKALCADCTAQYADGRVDCRHNECPVYVRMPYRKEEPNFIWLFGDWSSKYLKKAQEARIIDPNEYARKFLMRNGKFKVSMSDIYRAKCFRCMGNFKDPSSKLDFKEGQDKEKGRMDCLICSCSIYYWMPYRKHIPTYDWMFDSCHTTKHRLRLAAEGLTREEYIELVIGG